MSTLMIKQPATSDKVNSSKSSAMSINKPGHQSFNQMTAPKLPTSGHKSSGESDAEVVTLPKPRTKKMVKKGSFKKEPDPTAQAVIAMGGQVIGSKLPVIGPPVLFDENQLRVAFSLLDVNGDGKINCDELMSMLNKLGLKDFINENIVKCLIKDATKESNPDVSDEDILITEEQFVNWMPRLGLTGQCTTVPDLEQLPSSSSATAADVLGQYSSSRKDSSGRKSSLASTKSSSSSVSSYQSASSNTSTASDRKSSTASDRRATPSSYTITSRSGSIPSSSSPSVPSSRSESINSCSKIYGDIDNGQKRQSLEEDDAEKDLRAAFAVFDQDHNGFITREELISAMSFLGENLTEADIDDLIMKADTDKDGQINYEEFLQALM